MNKLIKLLANNRRQMNSRAIENKGDETTIYIYDAIVSDELTAEYYGGVSAEAIVPQIRAIKGGTIHLRINSPGGDVFAAQAIISAIRDTGAKVIAHIDGFAASAATVIATAADEVKISDGALYMIHCGWTIAIGNAQDMRSTADLLDKVDSVIVAQYAKRTGKTADEIKTLMMAETWMTAQEAVDAGFANSVADTPKIKAQWDLSAYEKAPKQAQGISLARKKEMPSMNIDVMESDFLRQMIPHHKMAVQMASQLIQDEPEGNLRDFAEGIIRSQSGEIELMTIWLGTDGESNSPNNLITHEHRERQQQRLNMLLRVTDQ